MYYTVLSSDNSCLVNSTVGTHVSCLPVDAKVQAEAEAEETAIGEVGVVVTRIAG